MNKKKELLKILLICATIFFSCYYVIPIVVYDQKDSACVQAELLLELKKFGISEDLQEIYIKKEKRFSDKKTELELIFSPKTNFMKLADECMKNKWKVIRINEQEKEITMKKDSFFIMISNDGRNTKLKIYKI